MRLTPPDAVRRALEPVRCFLLDMDGTFYLGDRILEGSLEFLDAVARAGLRTLFVTNNSSRSAAYYVEKLERMGVREPFLDVLTSGQATAYALNEAYPGRSAFVLGNEYLASELEANGVALDERHPDLVIVGFDTTLTFDRLCRCCDFLRAGLPFVATHPDLNCPTETGFIPDCGSILALIEASTGRRPDLIVGKPEIGMVNAAMRRSGCALSELAMVGDRLYTDIRMGSRHGLVSILVLTGEATAREAELSQDKPTIVIERLQKLIEYLPTR